MNYRAYEIPRNHNYDGYQRALARMIYKFFEKKTGSGTSVNEQLDKESCKPVIKKFKRRKVYARFRDNIWAADLVEIELLSSKKNKMLSIFYYKLYKFSLNIHGLNLQKIEKVKQFFMLLSKY